MDTNELIARAQKGDESALTALYHEHRAFVYRRCNQMLRNPADAEDLTQETFLKLHQKVGLFRFESTFATWLYRLTTNVVLMHLRAKQGETVSLEDMEREPADTRQGTGSGILKAINNLPESLREVANLRLSMGYNTKETSTLLGIHPMAVVRRFTKAKAVLRKQFAPIARMAH